MNGSTPNMAKAIKHPATKVLWAVFIVYIILSGYTMAHHELWGDEVHSWNIAKASGSYSDLIAHARYEGHPLGWYTILWTLSKLTHHIIYMQVVEWIIACAGVCMILFLSPFPLTTRMLMPFGYYFLFEYGVMSRNYGIGVLLALCICLIMRKSFRYKLPLYYGLLFCLFNIHLLTMLLAASLHLYFLLLNAEQKKRKSVLLGHTALGLLLFLPGFYCIFPPSDSALDVHFWMKGWNFTHQLRDFVYTPLRSFLPIPAWWLYHFWNTQFLLEARNSFNFLKFINPLLSLAILTSAFFVLRNNKKSVALFSANTLFSLIITMIAFTLTTARYAGFFYIGFIVAFWLFCEETPVMHRDKRLVNGILALQMIAGLFIAVQDIRLPFSNLYKVKELVQEIPANEKLVTDYWTMNGVVAYTDTPVYCLDTRRTMSFVMWDRKLSAVLKDTNRYTTGLDYYFKREGINKVYMISLASPQVLFAIDPQLPISSRVDLIDRKEGAIEKGSNVYLYKISENHVAPSHP